MYKQNLFRNKQYQATSGRSKTIDVILSTLHEKNPREEHHSRRVSELCQVMAEKRGMEKNDIKLLGVAGLMHDIGKIEIQEDLLNKPGNLTVEEYKEICRHSKIGHRILNTAPDMADIAEIVLSHHERWDGKGYPNGLSGESIPLFSRIIAIVDAFDAMTSDRSYRKAMSYEMAIEELRNNSGKQFDPDLITFFIDHMIGLSPNERDGELS